jgi:hypothetical protein
VARLLETRGKDFGTEEREVMDVKADVTILMTAVDEELYTRLLVMANSMGVSVSDVAMLALAAYMEDK